MDNSYIVDIFVGQLKSTLKCTHCGHCSVTFDPFWDLSLPIPQRTDQLKLSQCLDSFTREETLDGDEKPTCSKCRERRKCTKSLSIHKFPRVLVIHLKRFSPTERSRGKLNVTIDFPLGGLDMSNYAAANGAHCPYKLYALSNHSGTTYSGHYTAHCRHPYSKTWYEYNDLFKISRCTLGPILSDWSFNKRSTKNLRGPKRPIDSPNSTEAPTSHAVSSHVHAEWEQGHGGFHGMEVEVREEASSGRASSRYPITLLGNNTPGYPVADAPVVIVRVEEVLLVVLVLIIWVAAIALFINRWGKIRMLEPYQPKFHQQPHRPSCPLAPLSPPGVTNQVSLSNSITMPAALRNQKSIARMSFSKYNVNALTDPLSALPSPIIRRPRQNSVFVGSSTIAMLNPPPRRSKSAIDIQHLVVNEHSPTASLTGSIIPILNRERRPSLITIERPYYASRHRPSITIDRPYIHHQYRKRRSSCLSERIPYRHRNFISFEHSIDRKTLPILDRPSCSHHPTISFETPLESMELPTAPAETKEVEAGAKPKLSRSFEQPTAKLKPERLVSSFDVAAFDFHRRSSIPEEDRPEEDRSSPVSIQMEESKITEPLLEGLRSSHV